MLFVVVCSNKAYSDDEANTWQKIILDNAGVISIPKSWVVVYKNRPVVKEGDVYFNTACTHLRETELQTKSQLL